MVSPAAREGVFISYARADGEQVARGLHARLRADAPDIDAWLDRYEIEGGIGWWNQIERELERVEFLMLVMTAAALRSENTRNEWRSARQVGVCVYPVKGVPDEQLDYTSLPRWMRKAHFYDPQAEWAKLIAHLRRGCQATRVPFMAPSLPAGYVARHREIDSLLDLLLARDGHAGPTVASLRGPGGFGKTTLAAAICHNDRALDAFDDGVLWVRLGKAPNLLNELVKLYAALTGNRPGFVDVDDASRELALKLETKNCLIVIDDAWDAAHVAPFVKGADGCARLITTRLFDVVSDVPRIEVDQMTRAEAVQLLLARAGVTTTAIDPFRTVVARLGEWPLAIKLAGSAMRQRIGRGDTTERALDYVVRALEKRGITAFDRDQTDDRSDAVARTVAASFDLLDAESQRRCTELSIFPEGAAIPIATASTLWQVDDMDGEDLARTLDDLALIEFDLGRGVVRLHAVLRAFFSTRLTSPQEVHAKLLDYWRDSYALPDAYAWRAFAYHMHQAGRAADMRRLLLDVRWLDRKLHATDIHFLIADFEQVGPDAAVDLVRDALRLSAPALGGDATQLRAQLIARLQSVSEPDIVTLCGAARRTAAAWLQLLHPTLDMPGGMLVMTLVGHQREVTALAVDAEQRWLLSGSSDTAVNVWDARAGQLVHVLQPHKLGVRAIALTPDGQRAVVGAADGLIYLWDVPRGQLLGHFSRRAGRAVTGVALSADGGVTVSAARDGILRVWDVETRTLRHVLRGHKEPVTTVAMGATGKRAASGSDDGTIGIWDVGHGVLERTLEGHAGPVNAVAMSADGRFVVSGSLDRTVKVWDADSGVCLRTLEGHAASVTAVAMASRRWRAISGSSDQHAKLWDLETGRVLADLEGHTDTVTAVTIDEAGTLATTASADRTIKAWRVDALRGRVSVDAHQGAIEALVFSPDGRLLASGGEDGVIKVRDVESGRVVRSIEAHTTPVRTLAFSSDGSCVLSGGDDLSYRLWTIESGEGTWIPIRHLAPVDCSALSATARYLTTSCGDRNVNLWDVPSGVLVERYGTRRLFNHLIPSDPSRSELSDTDEYRDMYLAGEPVFDVVLVQMASDGGFVVFSAVKREPSAIRPIALTGTLVDTGAGRACLLVLNVSTGEIRSINSLQHQAVRAFALNRQATQVLWAHADHRLELWDLDREECLMKFLGHTDKVNAVVIDPGGTRAISCARDRSVRVWDLERGKALAAFTADAALRSVAVAPGEDIIAVGDMAGRVHLLHITANPPSTSPNLDAAFSR
jgi:WD40 repeat protein